MRTKLVTAPAALPVTLQEVKDHCGVSISNDDNLLLSLIAVAVGRAQDIMGRQLVTATWDLFRDGFPAFAISIPRAPLQAITSITYVDVAGVTQTVNALTYAVDTVCTPGVVHPVFEGEWPETREQRNAVTIRYTAGWPMNAGNTAWTGPDEIKTWIKMRVSTLYEHREALAMVSNQRLVAAIPRDFVDGLLDAYMVYGGTT